MKKTLIIVAALVIGLPLLALGVLALAIDPIVRSGTERMASSALQVPTTLEAADVRLSGGATLNKLAVANPPGYSEPRAVSFEKFDASVRVGSLLGDVVEVGDVLVQRPELTVEFLGTKSNWSKLMDNLASRSPKGKDAPRKEDADGKKFRIAKIRIEAATVHFRSDLISGGARSFTLPPLELRGIGTAEGGATTAEVLGMLFQSLASAALQAAEGSLPQQLLQAFNSEIVGAAQSFRGAIDSATQILRDLPSKGLEEATRELKDLKDKELKDLKDAGKDLLDRKKKAE